MIKFISLYSVFCTLQSDKHETKESAVNQLIYGEDEGLCMPIAVIDISDKSMVWFHEYLGESECKKIVDKFLNKI